MYRDAQAHVLLAVRAAMSSAEMARSAAGSHAPMPATQPAGPSGTSPLVAGRPSRGAGRGGGGAAFEPMLETIAEEDSEPPGRVRSWTWGRGARTRALTDAPPFAAPLACEQLHDRAEPVEGAGVGPTAWAHRSLTGRAHRPGPAVPSSPNDARAATARTDVGSSASAPAAAPGAASARDGLNAQPLLSLEDYQQLEAAGWLAVPPPKMRHKLEYTAFIIACHNSASKVPGNWAASVGLRPYGASLTLAWWCPTESRCRQIRRTLETLLVHVEPWQVFVADNGSTESQVDETAAICHQVTDEYRRRHPEYKEEGGVNFGRCGQRQRAQVTQAPGPGSALTHASVRVALTRHVGDRSCSISEGSKTMAQFCTAFNILSSYPHIAYVTMIDDDTLVPESTPHPNLPPTVLPESLAHRRLLCAASLDLCLAWDEDTVINMFARDPTTAGLAYPLRASNREHTWPQFQDLEYMTAGYMKIAQVRGAPLLSTALTFDLRLRALTDACPAAGLPARAQAAVSTTLFASGAINTWRIEVIVDILFRHDTMHHGDDLQQGLILHSLRGKSWFLQTPEHVTHTVTYRMDVYEEAVTATDVPVHWFHIHDIWPRRWLKHAPKRCACGEPSLFLQRAKGWDLSRQRFLFKYIKVRCQATGEDAQQAGVADADVHAAATPPRTG